MEYFKFDVGAKVDKVKGYKFPGTVVSAFRNSLKEKRYVVEMDNFHLLHIFNEEQLCLRNGLDKSISRKVYFEARNQNDAGVYYQVETFETTLETGNFIAWLHNKTHELFFDNPVLSDLDVHRVAAKIDNNYMVYFTRKEPTKT